MQPQYFVSDGSASLPPFGLRGLILKTTNTSRVACISQSLSSYGVLCWEYLWRMGKGNIAENLCGLTGFQILSASLAWCQIEVQLFPLVMQPGPTAFYIFIFSRDKPRRRERPSNLVVLKNCQQYKHTHNAVTLIYLRKPGGLTVNCSNICRISLEK